jgi:hypothetical protein
MKICLRFHMSRIFDTGWASKLLEALKGYGEITAVVSGTTGTVAMIDSGLAVTPLRERFVDWVRAREFDLIVNATHATSVERMLADCWHLSKKVRFPIIGIDTNSGTVAYWGDVKGVAEDLTKRLGFKLVQGPDFGVTFWREGDKEHRRVLAVEPGDWILVNGIVVSRAVDRDVVFVCQSGRIVEVRGAEVKPHGLQKLGHVDLESAKIDTVKVLRDEVKKRAKVSYSVKNKVAFVDHAGYDVFKFLDEGICCAVTVGDDTTAIVGDVLERFVLPIIEMVDGNRDGLVRGERLHV